MTIDNTKRYTDSDGRQWWARLDQSEKMTHYWCPERGVRAIVCAGLLNATAKARGCIALEPCPEYDERIETMWGWAEATGWQRYTRDLAEDDCHALLWPGTRRWLPVEATAEVLARRYGAALLGAKMRDPEGDEGVVSIVTEGIVTEGMITMDYPDGAGAVWWRADHLTILAPPEHPAQSEAPQEPSEPGPWGDGYDDVHCDECHVVLSSERVADGEQYCGYCEHRLADIGGVEPKEYPYAEALSAAAKEEERRGPVMRHVRKPAKAPIAEQWGAGFETKEWR